MNAGLQQIQESLGKARAAISEHVGITENLASFGAHVLPVGKATLVRLVDILLEQISAAPDVALPADVLADVAVLKGEIDTAVTGLIPQVGTPQAGYAAPALVSLLLSISVRLKPVLSWSEVVSGDKMPSTLAKRSREIANRLDKIERDAHELEDKKTDAQTVLISVDGAVTSAKLFAGELEKLNAATKASADGAEAAAASASQNLDQIGSVLKRAEEIGAALAATTAKSNASATEADETAKTVANLAGKVAAQAESVAKAETRVVTAAEEGAKAREKISGEAEQIAKILAKVAENGAEVQGKKSEVDAILDKVKNSTDEALRAKEHAGKHASDAEALAKQAKEAYRIVSTAGLSGAFHQRAERLNLYSWSWVGVLGVALYFAFRMGSERSKEITALLGAHQVDPVVILIQVILSVLSVGAPVWMAWLATKQISYLFRLSEDYGFKATVAKAYEGFRDEAVKFDVQFSARLFATALQRMDENPLRYVSDSQPGSPMQELFQQPFFQEAMNANPSFKDRLLAFWKSTPWTGVQVPQAGQAALTPKGDTPKTA